MIKSIRYIIIIIFILTSVGSYSQTLFSLNFGINVNNYIYNKSWIFPSIEFNGKSNLNLGFEFSQYILHDFDVKLGGSYYLKDFSYVIDWGAAFNPYYIYSYKYGNLYLSFGYNIVEWINTGIGIKKMIFYYYQYEDYINGIEKKSTYSNINMLIFHVNFLYRKLIFSINYNKSFNISPTTFELLTFNKFDIFEFELGYRFNISKGKNK